MTAETKKTPVADNLVNQVRLTVEEVIAPLQHLKLVDVAQYTSTVAGRTKLHPSLTITLSGYAPSLHRMQESVRLKIDRINEVGIPEAVDEALQSLLDAYQTRLRLSEITFGHEVPPLARSEVGHITMNKNSMQVLVELEGSKEGAAARIALGVNEVISRRERGDQKWQPPYRLQGFDYGETIEIGNGCYVHNILYIPTPKDTKDIAAVIKTMPLPALLRDATITTIRSPSHNPLVNSYHQTDDWTSISFDIEYEARARVRDVLGLPLPSEVDLRRPSKPASVKPKMSVPEQLAQLQQAVMNGSLEEARQIVRDQQQGN